MSLNEDDAYRLKKENADLLERLEKAEQQLKEAVELLRDAQMHIEGDNIDWSKMNDGPDHDPNYKPAFPQIVSRLDAFLAARKGASNATT